MMVGRLERLYVLGDPPTYDPVPSTSLVAMALRRGVPLPELAYELLIADDGRNIFYLPGANYEEHNLNHVHEMMSHPGTVLGLGDGGAHYGVICDSSYPTFALSHWVRDSDSDDSIALPAMIAALSRETAMAVGLSDRGLIAPGLKADINIIDLDRLKLHAPRAVYDLPTNGRRMVQKAEGYDATIVSGEIVYRNGTQTGARPGRLVRGH